MSFTNLLTTSPLILTECAISERLRRIPGIELHPQLFNTPLIYDTAGRTALESIYSSYREVARKAQIPILLCAPTWRIDRQQTLLSGASPSIVGDAIAFMKALEERWQDPVSPLFTGALLAPKNDCYSPGKSLIRQESSQFHSWQIEQILDSDVSVIIAQTMPAVQETLGMADILSTSQTPYILSFVIASDGNILDGTPLWEAIQIIDNETVRPPVGYMINCVYPTFVHAEQQPPALFQRLIGIQANASSKSHQQLDGASTLQQDPLPDWGKNMLILHHKYGMKLLGGCCGTDQSYLQFLIDHQHS
ncbi:MAG: homocysteine S-methyltransferase [Desulforhopalus sp.]|jgi:homocysteine S-methyltransferase